MGDEQESAGGKPGRESKVARLIEEYDLDGIGAELEEKWTAEEGDRWSLRDLADYFNRELLRQALRDAGVQTVDGEIENTYRLLTGEDVSGADQVRVQRHLERDGVDVRDVESEFVSYQAVRTYLRNYRNARYETSDAERLERAVETIRQLQSRADTVTESKVEQLENAGMVEVGEFHTIVDITVICEDCGGRYEVTGLLSEGSCRCA